MKTKTLVKSDKCLVSVKISADAKRKADELHSITGRTRLHILNASIADYWDRHAK